MEGIFSIEVDWTDRTVVDGAFASFAFPVEVMAGSEREATLTAAQMSAIAVDPDCVGERMMVATRVVGVRV